MLKGRIGAVAQAGQGPMMRKITKLQEIAQYILDKNSKPRGTRNPVAQPPRYDDGEVGSRCSQRTP
jgi:hypothetical protein